METLFVVVIVAVIGYIVYKMVKTPDVNGDGKVDVQDVVSAAKEVVQEAKAVEEKVVEKVKKARKPKKPKA
jgi:beta-lactam-binding protein with PASTA domain